MNVSPLNSSDQLNSFANFEESHKFLLQDDTNNDLTNVETRIHMENFSENPHNNLHPDIQKMIKESTSDNGTFPAIKMSYYDPKTKEHHNWYPTRKNQKSRDRSWEYDNSQNWDTAGTPYTQEQSNQNDNQEAGFVTLNQNQEYSDVDPLANHQDNIIESNQGSDHFYYKNMKDKNLYYYDDKTDSLLKINQITKPMDLLKDPRSYTLDNMSEERIAEMKHGTMETETPMATELAQQLNNIAKQFDKKQSVVYNKPDDEDQEDDNTKEIDQIIIYTTLGISGVSFLILIVMVIYFLRYQN